MKKINQLKINPERLMDDIELKKLMGGYGSSCTCLCWDISSHVIKGYLLSESGDCPYDCAYAWSNSTGVCQC